MRAWVLIGPPRHWEISFSRSPAIWGFTGRYFTTYQQMSEDDLLLFYATSPTRGFVGYGRFLRHLPADSTEANELIWPREKDDGAIVWRLRFSFTVRLLPGGARDACAVKEPLPFFQTSVLELPAEQAARITQRLDAAGVVSVESPCVGIADALPPAPVIAESPSLHEELIRIVFDMGQIQNYFPQREFPLAAGGRLDVVWRRMQEGVPAFAFEVEVSNNFEKALARLKSAHQHWNAAPRLIGNKDASARVTTLLSCDDPKFRNQLKFISADRLREFYRAKKEFKQQESELGFSD